MQTVVISNQKLTAEAPLYSLRMSLPENAPAPSPGQFAHILCGSGTTLRRPVSIADSYGNTIRICYDVRGKGTEYLSALRPGDPLDVLMPLGHGFTIPETGNVLLIGGGIGVFPLFFAARRLKERAQALLGFRSSALICCTDDFKAFGCGCQIVTDDGSFGKKGVVTELISEAAEKSAASLMLACGPSPMLEAVSAEARRLGLRCEVSLEERMACGVGACMGCACRVKAPVSLFPDGYTFKRVCADGPVFDSEEVIWR